MGRKTADAQMVHEESEFDELGNIKHGRKGESSHRLLEDPADLAPTNVEKIELFDYLTNNLSLEIQNDFTLLDRQMYRKNYDETVTAKYLKVKTKGQKNSGGKNCYRYIKLDLIDHSAQDGIPYRH